MELSNVLRQRPLTPRNHLEPHCVRRGSGFELFIGNRKVRSSYTACQPHGLVHSLDTCGMPGAAPAQKHTSKLPMRSNTLGRTGHTDPQCLSTAPTPLQGHAIHSAKAVLEGI